VPPEPTPFVNSAQGVRRFGFWGAFARLPTTTTPNSLQRLRCYDDDMVDPTDSSNATGYMFLSLLFIYVLFFLSILQSYFLYTWLEHVLFIMCKLPSFVTDSKSQTQ
jgi:hypothetical protein